MIYLISFLFLQDLLHVDAVTIHSTFDCKVKRHSTKQRGATNKEGRKWPKDDFGFVQVPYVFDPLFSNESRTAVEAAIVQYDWYTCINLREANDDDETYLKFIDSPGCASYVGMQGPGPQEVDLASTCGLEATVHEIMHALGFYHEQSRPDRDQFVDIFWQNINKEYWPNFELSNNINSLGTEYDVESLMHYGSYAFSNNTDATILQKSGDLVPTQLTGFSEIDIDQLNLLYECNGLNKAPGNTPTDCYYSEDNGLSYRGTVATTENGSNCSPWNEIIVNFETYRHHLGNLRENFCRNYQPDKQDKPFCFDSSVGSFVACNIPVCGQIEATTPAAGATQKATTSTQTTQVTTAQEKTTTALITQKIATTVQPPTTSQVTTAAVPVSKTQELATTAPASATTNAPLTTTDTPENEGTTTVPTDNALPVLLKLERALYIFLSHVPVYKKPDRSTICGEL